MKRNHLYTSVLISSILLLMSNESFSQLYLNLEKDKEVIKENRIKKIEAKYYSKNKTNEDNGTVITIREFDENGNLTLDKNYSIFDSGSWRVKEHTYKNNRLNITTKQFRDYPKEHMVHEYYDNNLLQKIKVYKGSLNEKPYIIESFEYDDNTNVIKYKHDLIANKRACVYKDRMEVFLYDNEKRLKEKEISYVNNCYVLKHTYEYDDLGNLIKDSRKDKININETNEYTWDKRNRLIKERRQSKQLKEKRYKYNRREQVKLEKHFKEGQYEYKIKNKFNSKGLIKKRIWDGYFDENFYVVIKYSFYNR